MRVWVLLILGGCPRPADEPGSGAEICGNGRDDEGDGYADCTDPECADTCVEACGNGVDDDGDGRADCEDAACGWACSEDCGNGIDDDGDWIVDCADDGCASTCDGDGDGHPSPEYGGDDCDDRDDSAYPGAPEIYYDGADNDCDPATVDDDQDADGAGEADDCNDLNPHSFPGAVEVCGDGEVNDCDAVTDPAPETCFGERSFSTADHHLQGVESEGAVGWSVAGVGDTDGDGDADLLVGAYALGPLDEGGAYVVNGPIVDRFVQLASAACELTGVGDMDWAGSWVAVVGDLDGDALPDAAVGARYQDVPEDNAGRIYILEEPCASGTVGDNAIAVWGESHDELGTMFTGGADLTGDGADDLIAGAPLRNFTGLPDQGAVLIFDGPILNVTSTPDAYGAIYGGWRDGLAGTSVAIPGDVDGDGRADLVLGAPFASPLGDFSGEAYVFTEMPTYDASVDEAWATLAFGDAGDHFGKVAAKVGDVDGDGRGDVAVTAPDSDNGTVYLLSDVEPPTLYATLDGAALGDTFGAALAGLRDVNGDTQPDLAVGAPGVDTAAEDAGAVYVFFGPLAGATDAADAAVTLLGEAAFDYAGASLASAGDVDADGAEDLIAGAPYHDAFGAASGVAYVLTFGW